MPNKGRRINRMTTCRPVCRNTLTESGWVPYRTFEGPYPDSTQRRLTVADIRIVRAEGCHLVLLSVRQEGSGNSNSRCCPRTRNVYIPANALHGEISRSCDVSGCFSASKSPMRVCKVTGPWFSPFFPSPSPRGKGSELRTASNHFAPRPRLALVSGAGA